MRLARALLVPSVMVPLVACVGAPPVIESYPHSFASEVELQGVTVHYLDFNPQATGPVLIWVHGQSGAAFETFYLQPHLPPDYRLIALDLPGNGLSEKPVRNYTEEFYQEVVADFVRYLNVTAYTLVAHSLGGVSVLPFAATQPPGLQSLILIAPYYFAGQGGGFLELLSNTGPLVDFAMFVYAPWMLRLIVRSNAFFDSAVAPEDLLLLYQTAVFHTPNGRGALASVTRNLVGHRRTADTLADISVPTLIVWGREDTVIAYRHSEKFTEAIPESVLITLEQCGHVPHIEMPDVLASHISVFLQSR